MDLNNCSNCNTKLLEDARFCHLCGTEVSPEIKVCINCEEEIPLEANFCPSCGHSINETPSKIVAYKSIYILDFSDVMSLERQIKEHFFKTLRLRLEEQYNEKKYKQYKERFHESIFEGLFDKEISVLAYQVHQYSLKNLQAQEISIKIDRYLDLHFGTLLNRFLIAHASDLNNVQLPSDILHYEYTHRDTVNLQQMILTFLDLKTEDEMIFTNFVSMPVNKLKNACKAFLFPKKDEAILLICDQSTFGSCREGFAFTANALYWKAHLNKAQKVLYQELLNIEKEEDWLNVNGKYFNINRSLNAKMAILLRKLRALYRPM